jgi:hypothetical protein
MNTEFVKAPPAVSLVTEIWTNGATRVTGAWATTRVGRRVWLTQFAGTHQGVTFRTSGKTPGRSLRAMRRALAVEQIPVL